MLIFHIATAADWSAAVEAGAYRVSTLGSSIDDVGFIHASTAEQVQATASRFYAGTAEPLVVLVMDDANLREADIPVLLEDAGNGELFPHLYAELPTTLVAEVRHATFDSESRFIY